MSLVAAAIIPHAPILVPTIGDFDTREKFKKTISAINTIKENLEKIKPDTIIIISPKINKFKDSFCINISENFCGDFIEFGELKTSIELKGDIGLVLKIRKDEQDENTKLITKSNLDYELTVPLYFLTQNIKPRIIPIESSNLNLKNHFEFGKDIKEAIFDTNKKIAVIASVALSGKTKKESPLGYTKKGETFDKKIIELLETKNKTGLLNMKEYLIKEVSEYGLKPISLLLGILNEVNYQPETLSYENHLGTGYLTMNFKI
ncbi:MAG: class III extradiol dioxygenase subunit B-like domain-containing protein [Patescibacteria group bacterium]